MGFKPRTRRPPRWIAERQLRLERPDGSAVPVVVKFGRPYKEGPDSACPLSIEPLYGRLVDVRGVDAIQAVCLAMRVARVLLEKEIERGSRLYWADSDDTDDINDPVDFVDGWS